jgi:hypothetical protein
MVAMVDVKATVPLVTNTVARSAEVLETIEEELVKKPKELLETVGAELEVELRTESLELEEELRTESLELEEELRTESLELEEELRTEEVLVSIGEAMAVSLEDSAV